MQADRTKTAQVSQLVARAMAGDRAAFDSLVDLYTPQVYNLAFRITGSREEAEDCVQEVFVRVFAGLSTFRGEAAFFTWVYRVAINVASGAASRAARRPKPASALTGGDPDEPTPDLEQGAHRAEASPPPPEEEVLARQRRELLLGAIRSLPAHHRTVVILYELNGLSYQEIARITNTRVGTVKSRLNRARLALREILSPHLELLRG